MLRFKQYLKEIFDERIDALLAGKLAKHSQEQFEKHHDMLKNMFGVRPEELAVIDQKIKNRKNIQKRLKNRP